MQSHVQHLDSHWGLEAAYTELCALTVLFAAATAEYRTVRRRMLVLGIPHPCSSMCNM